MIVSHSNKFIGIKTRKAASSSIEIGLNEICEPGDMINVLNEHKSIQRSIVGDKIDEMKELRSNKVRANPHSPISTARNIVLGNDWDKYFKFTIERNPGDKVVSLYFYWKKQGKLKSGVSSFSEFIEKCNFGKCRNGGLYTENNNITVDYIMRYENIEEEMKYISSVIGKDIKLYKENNHQRPKDKRNYRDLYNSFTKKEVRRVFRKEIDYFKYTF